MLDLPSPEIVVTASRLPEPRASAAASVSVIDQSALTRVGAPLVSDYLRLLPSSAVSTSGPAGSLTEVRIRGAEANHTLLFIDGIRANDPAAGNNPRFELLNADIASRIELVRGPQSALWGSEAIGGVIAVEGDPAATTGATLLAEGGSFRTGRGAAAAAYAGDTLRASLVVAGQKSRSIDAFDGSGDRDGYDNASLRGRLAWQAAPLLEFGLAGFAVSGLTEYDGYSPITFLHADTLDNSRQRLGAVRGWVRAGQDEGLGGTLSASWLGSSNINRLAGAEVNRTRAERRTVSGQVHDGFRLAGGDQRLILALDHEEEEFHARDAAYFGATTQDRTRHHRSATLEWRGDWQVVAADVAVRRDAFNRFADATTLRTSLLARLGGGVVATASYGEGIAQPTFFDLYGFFPGSFLGNPSLKPESSRGVEASLRWQAGPWTAALTAYRQRLRNEIVDTLNSATFTSSTVNAVGTSRREGVEAEAGWSASPALRLSGQLAWLDASQPGAAVGVQVKENRRPRWSGALLLDGERGRLSYGATLSYSGARLDTDFDQFPAARVRLGAYWLAGARIVYRLSKGVEFFGRVANAFDEEYREVVGYRPAGRSVDGGIRLALGG